MFQYDSHVTTPANLLKDILAYDSSISYQRNLQIYHGFLDSTKSTLHIDQSMIKSSSHYYTVH